MDRTQGFFQIDQDFLPKALIVGWKKQDTGTPEGNVQLTDPEVVMEGLLVKDGGEGLKLRNKLSCGKTVLISIKSEHHHAHLLLMSKMAERVA